MKSCLNRQNLHRTIPARYLTVSMYNPLAVLAFTRMTQPLDTTSAERARVPLLISSLASFSLSTVSPTAVSSHSVLCSSRAASPKIGSACPVMISPEFRRREASPALASVAFASFKPVHLGVFS
ncbi:hypothetical protein VTO42DRAFT_8096 [Malbranchea cinnamomea]